MNNINVLEIRYDYAGVPNAIYPVILSDESECILIDCGYPGFLPIIRNFAKEKGIDISRITKIIVTHHDFDHMGALAEFKKEYPQIEILASIEDEKYISGKEKSLRLQQAEAIYDKLPECQRQSAKEFQRILESVAPVAVDRKLRDG